MCRNLSAHLDETTRKKKPILLPSSPQSCTACCPSPWGAFHTNSLNCFKKKRKKITDHCTLCCDWCDFQVKECKRPSEKPYSHTSDCLTGFQWRPSLHFLLTWRFQRWKKERLDLSASHTSGILYCSVPTVQWERPANTSVPVSQCNQTFNKAFKGRFYSNVNG